MYKNFNLKVLQQQQKKWVNHNFPGRPDYFPLLGVVEELGELAHAHLKQAQKIRKQDYRTKKKDAVGDIIIFLSDYCNSQDIDMQEVLYETWQEVKKRDWKRFPKNGKTE